MGVVISASIILIMIMALSYSGEWFKTKQRKRKEIEGILFKKNIKDSNTRKTIGQVIALKEAGKVYLDFLVTTIPQDFARPEFKDCSYYCP